MLLIVLLVLVIIVDQYCEYCVRSRKFKNYMNGGVSSFVSTVLLIFGTLIFSMTKLEQSISIQTYNQTKEIYDHQMKNFKITGEERAKLMDFCVNVNEEILYHRKYYKNWFIGIYYSKKIANFELLDFTKLPQPTKG